MEVLLQAAAKRREHLDVYQRRFKEMERGQEAETGAKDLAQEVWDEAFAPLNELLSHPHWTSPLPSPQAARQAGRTLVDRQNRALVQAVANALEGEEIAGLPVGYRGSMAAEPGKPAGQRGRQKASVRMDPVTSDVDLYVVAPRLRARARDALGITDTEDELRLQQLLRGIDRLSADDQAIVREMERGLTRVLQRLSAAGTAIHPKATFESSTLFIRERVP